MKILLVQPEQHDYPPFGLVTLAPYFRIHGHEVLIMESTASFHSFIRWQPEVVGFTCLSNQFPITKHLIRKVKNNLPNVKVMVGGPGVTFNPDYAQANLPDADVLVKGDGEPFVHDFPRVFPSSSDPSVYDSPLYNWENHLIADWYLIDWKKYTGRTKKGLAIESSRGCPFNCVFCTAHLICGRKWRPRKPGNVVNELRVLKQQYHTRRVYFTDDNATVSPSRWKQLMQEIVDANLNVELAAPEGLQAHHLNMETLRLMKQAGFKSFTIGAESGVQRVLDKVIDKGGLTVDQIESVVENGAELGLQVNCFFVIGIPGETLEEATATVEFAQKLRGKGAYSCMVRNAVPMPGTRMHRQALEHGWLTVEPDRLLNMDFVHSGRHLLETNEWSPDQIEKLVKQSRRQEARHLLTHKKKHLFSHGLSKLFTQPRTAVNRLKQLVKDAT